MHADVVDGSDVEILQLSLSDSFRMTTCPGAGRKPLRVRRHRTSKRRMSSFLRASSLASPFLVAVGVLAYLVCGLEGEIRAGTERPALVQESGAEARITRGKKLMLKDGTFQLVRSYERKGDRVRYLSAERGDWEEIPAAFVDWDATKKAEADAEKADAALVSKVHTQEEATKIETVLDVDASLQVAPGTFLPPGEGLFAVVGKSVTPIPQAGSQVKNDRANSIKRILVPIPIVAAKRNVELPGPHATLRFGPQGLEFYLREAPPDSEDDSHLERTSRQGLSGPEVVLLRATVKGNKRILESIRSMFGEQTGRERNEISIQQWEIARTVYRYTLSQPLEPGEYAMAEILPDGLNLFVWDFGVDARNPVKK